MKGTENVPHPQRPPCHPIQLTLRSAAARSAVRCLPVLGGRLSRQLRAMPDSHHPNNPVDGTVEEAKRLDNDFSVGHIRELGDGPARLRETLQPSQLRLDAATKRSGGIGVVSMDVRDRIEELSPSRRRKANLQRRANSSSASASTESRSNPFPFAISRSPLASSLRICRSFSERSNDSGVTMIAAARPRWVMTTGCPDRRTRSSTAAASWRRSVIGTISGSFDILPSVRQMNPPGNRRSAGLSSRQPGIGLDTTDRAVAHENESDLQPVILAQRVAGGLIPPLSSLGEIHNGLRACSARSTANRRSAQSPFEPSIRAPA